MTIYVLSGFNNYYNRRLRRFESISDYEPFAIHIQTGFNFVPNDGVDTQLVLGSNVNNYSGEGDYLLAVDDAYNITRWFIIDSVRDRAGQYTLTLHRDLIADFYNTLVDAPMFIEKATLLPNDPLVFNSEGMSVNQIKTNETLLQDETKSAWLVGYVSRTSTAEGQTPTPLDATIKYNLDYIPDYIVDDQSELPFNQYIDTDVSYAGEPTIDVFFKISSSNTVYFNSINRYGPAKCPLRLKINATETGYGWLTRTGNDSDIFYYGADKQNYVYSYLNQTPAISYWNDNYGGGNRFFAQYLYNAIPDSSWNTILSQIDLATGVSTAAQVSQYANKIVQIGDNLYKTKLESVSSSTGSQVLEQSVPQVEEIFRTYYNAAADAYLNDYPDSILAPISTSASSGKLIGIRTASAGVVRLTLEPFTNTKVTAKIKTDALATMCVDSPYDIITMPYSDTLRIKVNDTDTYTANKQLALATMTALLAQEGGAGAVKDVQLLPYCPLRQFIDEDGNIDLTISNEDNEFSTRVYYVTADETAVRLTPLLYCQYSTDSFDIPYTINITNPKMQNECDMYRLNSPNFASSFQFNAAKNNGVSKINVDFNYKPYGPYIHLNPDFGGLYGSDFNDPRGLICGGDFSITVITDAWEQYQLQNKNYEKTFQRQIENMEVQHEVARTQEIVGMIAGTGTGAAGGALTGSMIAPGIGTVIGATAGGIASLAGGIADIRLNEKLRGEALDYTKDMFRYQLGNIQALSNTIAKVSAFNRNNKIFPIIEYYTCTDKEKEALANKIAWNGMSVGAIGTMTNYIGNEWSYNDITSKGYIKGKLINLPTMGEDYHIVNALSSELDKGVYTKWE